jgi:Zinc finger, C3HC4 type (RING finger)
MAFNLILEPIIKEFEKADISCGLVYCKSQQNDVEKIVDILDRFHINTIWKNIGGKSITDYEKSIINSDVIIIIGHSDLENEKSMILKSVHTLLSENKYKIIPLLLHKSISIKVFPYYLRNCEPAIWSFEDREILSLMESMYNLVEKKFKAKILFRAFIKQLSSQSDLVFRSLSQRDTDTQIDEKNVDSTCYICMDRDPCMILMPCSHLGLCELCANEIKQCPKCRAIVEKIQKVYY